MSIKCPDSGIQVDSVLPKGNNIQSNFNGSNTYGTMKISSRQGQFELVRVDYNTMSGGLIWISFRFSLT